MFHSHVSSLSPVQALLEAKSQSNSRWRGQTQMVILSFVTVGKNPNFNHVSNRNLMLQQPKFPCHSNLNMSEQEGPYATKGHR